jgi:hypothetical protein
LHVHDVIVTNAVNFTGRHTHFDLRPNHFEHLGSQPTCFAHGVDLSVGFGYDGAHQLLPVVLDPERARV